jgi:hypothetical protein
MNYKTAKANCEEKTSLLVAYQAAAEAYSHAVAELAKKVENTPKGEYSKLHDAAELARYRSLDAKDRLQRHLEEHGC